MGLFIILYVYNPRYGWIWILDKVMNIIRSFPSYRREELTRMRIFGRGVSKISRRFIFKFEIDTHNEVLIKRI